MEQAYPYKRPGKASQSLGDKMHFPPEANQCRLNMKTATQNFKEQETQGNATPPKNTIIQYPGLENSMECIVHGVAKSRI